MFGVSPARVRSFPPPMRRRAFTLACLLCSTSAPAQVVATAPDAPPPPASPDLVLHRDADLTTLGLRFDAGSAFSYGVGFLRVHEEALSRRGGLGASFWRGLGLDLRALSVRGDTLDAVQLNAVGRVSFLSCSGAGFEATLGVATAVGDRANAAQPSTVAVGSLGAFFGLHYVLVGYSYQVPLAPFERPDWLASHQFSLRVEIPVARATTREWQEPAPRRSD